MPAPPAYIVDGSFGAQQEGWMDGLTDNMFQLVCLETCGRPARERKTLGERGEESVGKSKREKRVKGPEGKPPAEERGALGPEEMKDRGFDNFLQSPSESAQRLLPLAHYSEPSAQQWVDPKSHRLSPSTEE
eukprot:superscaffoldBa00002576_g14700